MVENRQLVLRLLSVMSAVSLITFGTLVVTYKLLF